MDVGPNAVVYPVDRYYDPVFRLPDEVSGRGIKVQQSDSTKV